MRFPKPGIQLLFVLAVLVPAAAAAQTQIGAFDKWSAHMIREGRAKTCYMHSEPTKMEGDYTKRGRVFVQITHRPAEGTRDEVGFTAGYVFRKGSDASAVIDGKRYTLFTDRDTAWARDADSDRALVRAMMKGRRMTVRGVSSRGTTTTDTYSLIGFTKAYRAIGRACRGR